MLLLLLLRRRRCCDCRQSPRGEFSVSTSVRKTRHGRRGTAAAAAVARRLRYVAPLHG
jgi:hypothetical protein